MCVCIFMCVCVCVCLCCVCVYMCVCVWIFVCVCMFSYRIRIRSRIRIRIRIRIRNRIRNSAKSRIRIRIRIRKKSFRIHNTAYSITLDAINRVWDEMKVIQPGILSEKVTKIRTTIFNEILKKCVPNQKKLTLKTNTPPLNAYLSDVKELRYR
jgi:hypothetical protein